MKKTVQYYFALFISIAFLQSCDDGILLPSITGAPYEVLVVMDEKPWKSDSGKALFEMLSANTPGVNQAENMFSISRVNNENFTKMIQPARNIIQASISETYSRSKITYKKNVWASPQSVVVIAAPDNESFITTLNEHSEDICEFFVDAERKRQEAYYRKFYNAEASNKVKEIFGVQMYVPNNITKFRSSSDFFWSSNMSLEARQDIIVYSYPYTDADTFTEEYLLQKRDSVLKHNIPGPKKGSYMATEYQFEPIYKEIWKNGRYCAEIRGWWRVEGDLMGGPFISHTQLDEVNQRIVTIEGFVYAPGHNKRSFIRQLEAVVYAAKLPQDILMEEENGKKK